MDEPVEPLEVLWDSLLSREPSRIQKAFQGLSLEEQESVRAHLERMTTESGWHPEQRRSAQAALNALEQGKMPGKT